MSLDNCSSVWIVTDQLPFPPRNGITLPVFHYCRLLKASFHIRLLLLVDESREPTKEAIESNEQLWGAITLIRFKRQAAGFRILHELSGTEMFQHGWIPIALDRSKPVIAGAMGIVVSPISAVAKLRSAYPSFSYAEFNSIAAVNDCTAAEYYLRTESSVGGWKNLLKARLDRIRSRWIGKIERRLLKPYQCVLLQTDADKSWMRRLVGADSEGRVKLAPNGVNSELFSMPQPRGDNLLFVGELSGEYAAIVSWLISEVWPAILRRHPGIGLTIVGRGANQTLRSQIRSATKVTHHEFVPKIAEVYAGSLLAVVPVFKGFGLINKTLEAMACGLPVVGGIAAFNGIAGFENKVHGFVCEARSAQDFVETLDIAISDSNYREAVGLAGKRLISSQFDWASTVQQIAAQLAGQDTYQESGNFNEA